MKQNLAARPAAGSAPDRVVTLVQNTFNPATGLLDSSTRDAADSEAGITTTYAYDQQGRVKAWTESGGADTGSRREVVYDVMGRLAYRFDGDQTVWWGQYALHGRLLPRGASDRRVRRAHARQGRPAADRTRVPAGLRSERNDDVERPLAHDERIQLLRGHDEHEDDPGGLGPRHEASDHVRVRRVGTRAQGRHERPGRLAVARALHHDRVRKGYGPPAIADGRTRNKRTYNYATPGPSPWPFQVQIDEGSITTLETYRYDAFGRVKELTASDGTFIQKDYDESGNVTAVATGGARPAEFPVRQPRAAARDAAGDGALRAVRLRRGRAAHAEEDLRRRRPHGSDGPRVRRNRAARDAPAARVEPREVPLQPRQHARVLGHAPPEPHGHAAHARLHVRRREPDAEPPREEPDGLPGHVHAARPSRRGPGRPHQLRRLALARGHDGDRARRGGHARRRERRQVLRLRHARAARHGESRRVGRRQPPAPVRRLRQHDGHDAAVALHRALGAHALLRRPRPAPRRGADGRAEPGRLLRVAGLRAPHARGHARSARRRPPLHVRRRRQPPRPPRLSAHEPRRLHGRASPSSGIPRLPSRARAMRPPLRASTSPTTSAGATPTTPAAASPSRKPTAAPGPTPSARPTSSSASRTPPRPPPNPSPRPAPKAASPSGAPRPSSTTTNPAAGKTPSSPTPGTGEAASSAPTANPQTPPSRANGSTTPTTPSDGFSPAHTSEPSPRASPTTPSAPSSTRGSTSGKARASSAKPASTLRTSPSGRKTSSRARRAWTTPPASTSRAAASPS